MSNDTDPVQILVDQMMSEGRSLRVLEAGAGSRSHIRLGASAQLVGIDISQDQLDRHGELHEKILGDIQTFPLEPASFDIIFCWDVLEHLEHPEKSLDNFLRAIREGGLIVIGAPVASSLKGMITKYTPHWFHVFVYRHIFGSKNAGKLGYAPFPTFLRPPMSPGALRGFAQAHDLRVEYFELYEDESVRAQFRKKRLLHIAYRVAGVIARALSFGYVDPRITDFTLVLRKTAKTAAKPR